MIVFENSGEMDKRVISIMGVSVKQPGSIGYFGTGLKFALATLIRTGHEVVICIGEDVHEIGSEPTEIRGEPFELITMDGEELSYSTELGKDWEVWQAFRELACNARDEGGSIHDDDDIEPMAGKTIICVNGPGIEDAYADMDKIFFMPQKYHETDLMECADERSRYIYYKGIRVAEESTLHTYNIKTPITLTEDRTAKYYFELRNAVANYICREAEEDIVLGAVTERSGFEKDVDYSECYPSQAFTNVVKKLMKDRKYVNGSAKRNLIKRGLVEEPITLAATQPGEQDTLDRAVVIATKVEPNFVEYDIIPCEELSDGAYVKIEEEEEKRLYVTREALGESYDEVARMLLTCYYCYEEDMYEDSLTFTRFLMEKLITKSVGK